MPPNLRDLYIAFMLHSQDADRPSERKFEMSAADSGDQSRTSDDGHRKKNYDDILNDLIIDHWIDKLGLNEAGSSRRIGVSELDIQLLIRNALK